MFRMSRDGRRVLEKMRKGQGAANESPLDLLCLEIYMINHYPNPVISCISPGKKPFVYYRTIVDRKLGEAHFRPDFNLNGMISDAESSKFMLQYWRIVSDYLISDFSHGELIDLITISCTYKYDQIEKACTTATKLNVYSIAYIKAILERMQDELDDLIIRHDRIIQEANERMREIKTTKEAPKISQSVAVDLSAIFNKSVEDEELKREFDKLMKGR